MFDDFPACKRLLDAYWRVLQTPNKTPLAVLVEYTNRFHLRVSSELLPHFEDTWELLMLPSCELQMD